MVEESNVPAPAAEAGAAVHRRRKKVKKIPTTKIIRVPETTGRKVKVSQKMRKLYRKRARDYHSDSDDDHDQRGDSDEGGDKDERTPGSTGVDVESEEEGEGDAQGNDEGEAKEDKEDGEGDSDEEDHIQTGILKFVEGCRPFKIAFRKIMKRHIDDESLGPVLSAHQKLVVAKLAEEETERKAKKESTKQKHLVAEKGHVKPDNFLDSHEKILLGIATRGVVKFFNAVQKAQHAQKGLNPSRFKDAKALTKRRKEAFMSELKKASDQTAGTTSKASSSTGKEGDNQPAWAPLRDTFMLTNSKLKDWDKTAVTSDATEMDI